MLSLEVGRLRQLVYSGDRGRWIGEERKEEARAHQNDCGIVEDSLITL